MIYGTDHIYSLVYAIVIQKAKFIVLHEIIVFPLKQCISPDSHVSNHMKYILSKMFYLLI